MKGHMLASFFIFLKYITFIFIADFLTVAANVYYVTSESFVFPMTIVNLIFLMHFMLKETQAKRADFNKNLKKILYPDQEVK